MKVLVTTPTFPPYNSGLGNAVMRQVQALVSRDMEVVVATGGVVRNSRWDERGWRVEEFNVSGSDSFVNPLRGDVGSYQAFLRASVFDVILMNAWQTWSTDVCLRHLDEIPGKKVLYSHCLSTNVFFWGRPVRSLARYVLWRPYFFRLRTVIRQLDGLVALAPTGCDSRFEDVRIAQNVRTPIFVVPNTVSVETACHLDGAAVPPQYRKQIISVGSYDWLKGHDFVLRVYAGSSAKNVMPIKFFGQKFTPYVETLKKLAAQIGIRSDYVQFNEGVSGETLFDEYQKSLVFICGSHTECQPLALLDAMAAGTPFVSRLSGCIDSLPGGYAVADERAAVVALNRLLEDAGEWKNQSEQGRASVRARYRPEIMAKELPALISRIVA